MQTSGWEQKAPLRPHEGGGEPASLTPPGRLTRCWAGTARVAGGSPPPSSAASAAAPPGQPPLEARERAARTAREEDGGGANREPRREGRGRRQGLEAQAPREGLSGVGARDPRTSRTPSSSLPPHPRSRVPAREGERRGAVLVTLGKSPDKGKPRPPSTGPASPPPLLSNRRDPCPAQGRTQKGRSCLPHCQPVAARAALGHYLLAETHGQGWAVCGTLGSRFAANRCPCIFQCHLWL